MFNFGEIESLGKRLTAHIDFVEKTIAAIVEKHDAIIAQQNKQTEMLTAILNKLNGEKNV